MLLWSRTASPPPPSAPQPCAERLCSGRRRRGRVRSPQSRNSAAPSTPRWETPDLLGSQEDHQGTGDHPGQGSRSLLGPGRESGWYLQISYLRRTNKRHLSDTETEAGLEISVSLIGTSIQTKICLISAASRCRVTLRID